VKETEANKRLLRSWTFAIIIALVFGAYFLRNFISVIIVSVIAAYLFNPIHQWFLKRYKRQGISASLTFVISLLILIIPVALIVLILYLQIKHLLSTISSGSVNLNDLGNSLLNAVNNILARVPGAHQLTMADVTEAINHFIANAANSILNIISSSVGSISRIITYLIIYIYLFVNLLMHQDEILEILKKLNPLGRQTSEIYLHKMGSMTTAMGKGQFIIAAMQGFESALVLYLVGLHGLFLFFLVFLSFLSLIPLGAGIITIPIGMIMIFTGNYWQGIVVILNHLLVVTNIDNVVRPRLVPKSASLNSALTILSVFAGVGLFGFLGIIVGPVIMIVIVTTIKTYLEINKAKA